MSDIAKATMTIEEVAKALGIARMTAYQAARRGEIPTIRIGRRLLVPRIAFERMLNADAVSDKSRKS